MLSLNFSNNFLEAGTDEAGRGCLAGPVTAAAFICPEYSEIGLKQNPNLKIFFELMNDSKKLSEKVREKLRPIIEEVAISFAVSNIYEDVIDNINILNASILGMQESVLKLNPIPIYVIVDGISPLAPKGGTPNFINKLEVDFDLKMNRPKFSKSIPFSTIIKGDSKYISIAAASVLAKTYRDEYMNKIHEEFPMYNWKQNKGYPTKEHREAILKYGVTKYHRMSFKSPLAPKGGIIVK
jgi:ribonuclease HII